MTIFEGLALTLLTGGMGAGAKGIFALDITNPAPASEVAAAQLAKWEITEASDGFGNLGHVYGVPQLVKLKDGKQVVLVERHASLGGQVREDEKEDEEAAQHGEDDRSESSCCLYQERPFSGLFVREIRATERSLNPGP